MRVQTMPAQDVRTELLDAPAPPDAGVSMPPPDVERSAEDPLSLISSANDRAAPAAPRRLTPRRPPLWAVPVAVFAVLAALTVALWRTEQHLEALHADEVHFGHRASVLILW